MNGNNELLLIDLYFAHLREQGFSEDTLEDTYRHILQAYFRFVGTWEVEPADGQQGSGLPETPQERES